MEALAILMMTRAVLRMMLESPACGRFPALLRAHFPPTIHLTGFMRFVTQEQAEA